MYFEAVFAIGTLDSYSAGLIWPPEILIIIVGIFQCLMFESIQNYKFLII